MLATPAGYRLAPAFDLVPDIAGRNEHTLAFQYSAACPTREQLLALASQWRVSKAPATVDQVTQAVAQFPAVARKLGVHTGNALDSVRADIRRRLKLME